MARIETWFMCELTEQAKVYYPKGQLFSQDNQANLVGAKVYENGEEVELSGSVIGYCNLANGLSIPVNGSISGNQAYIILPQEAYEVPGLINIILKLIQNSQIMTLCAVVSTVFGAGGVIEDPSQQTIDAWTAQINATIAAVQAGNIVRYDVTQNLTDAQKLRARTNIGVASKATLISGENYKLTFY